MMDTIIENWKRKKRLRRYAREKKQTDKAIEAWQKRDPEGYQRARQKVEGDYIAQVSKYHMERGYITTPYRTWDEMKQGQRKYDGRALTKEECDAMCREYGIIDDKGNIIER